MVVPWPIGLPYLDFVDASIENMTQCRQMSQEEDAGGKNRFLGLRILVMKAIISDVEVQQRQGFTQSHIHIPNVYIMINPLNEQRDESRIQAVCCICIRYHTSGF